MTARFPRASRRGRARTLTNFERADVALTERRFVYERASFDPATRDGIGFGPGAISTMTSRDRRYATKWMNAGTSEAFVERMTEHGHGVASVFPYSEADLRLLRVTRNLARLVIDPADAAVFASQIGALEEARLVRREAGRLELTPEGMFYADAVAGFLAHDRVAELRVPGGDRNRAVRHHMG